MVGFGQHWLAGAGAHADADADAVDCSGFVRKYKGDLPGTAVFQLCSSLLLSTRRHERVLRMLA